MATTAPTDGGLADTDLPAELRAVITGLDLTRLREIRERHRAAAPGHGYSKYLDFGGQLVEKFAHVRRLQLARQPHRSVLDLGTGSGFFPYLCGRLGHRAAALDVDDTPMYDELVAALGVNRRVHRIEALSPLPDFGVRFDLVTAFQICFNGHKTPQVWTAVEWRWFLEHLASRHLAPGGAVFLAFNDEADGRPYTPELRRFFEEHGASVQGPFVHFSSLDRFRREILERPFAPSGQLAFTAALPAHEAGSDGPETLFRSDLVLHEDDMPLGPAHQRHSLVREFGAGRYSHWGAALWFSSSDGTDPNTNGRRYAISFGGAAQLGREGYELDELLAWLRESPGAAPPGDGHEAMLWRALDFITANSEHRIDGDHDRYAYDTPRVLHWMWAHQRGLSQGRPHLSCGPRAYALKALLDRLELTSRLVQVFSTRPASVGAHRFVEVLDPRDGTWSCWDPDHAVRYVQAGSGLPAGADAFVLLGPQHVVPERRGERGWEALQLAWLRDHDFAAVLFEAVDRAIGMRDPVILVDPLRFDPGRAFDDGERFDAWARRMFGCCRFVPVAAPR